MSLKHPENKPEHPELLSSEVVADLCSISVRTLWRLVAARAFPQPVRFNRKLVRWKRIDVQRWLSDLGSAA